ncbi:MAG: hypothetical protein ASARMPREDX12_001432 [Alectoria sarmentosa]|nr:MAG: hypothetical protein ASARMPREDX12_001432 [Alectoria sarmentosa]CAD6588594.1 MAG: hypothetical protein ASARMPRED_003608 [Alectoria sarmentosa]
MLYVQDTISTRSWEPIFNVRTRPHWVQGTVFDLMRQLKALRTMPTALPSIDTLALPEYRHLRVKFGDMNALCDAIEYILRQYGPLGVVYGGPDDRGTLWIKFYKMWADDRNREPPLQFIVYIDSRRPSIFAMQESSRAWSSVFPVIGALPPLCKLA